jgi:cytosine/adenosine deaminase-related metal-dependent hydrolase
MDPVLRDLQVGDVLVEGARIAAVAPAIDAGDARVVDVTDRIVLPGFVDTHRHTWETQLRGLCADWTLGDYAMGVRFTVAPHYEPDDVLIGNEVGALEALDAGITTLLDFSHIMRTPEHADAAVRGLERAGIRSLFCYGFFPIPGADAFADHAARFADFERVAHVHSGHDLITVGAAMTEIPIVSAEDRVAEIETARRADARQVLHTTGRNLETARFTRFFAERGLLGDDQVHVHCNQMDDDEWRALAAADAKISVSPETELNMGMGNPVIGECRQYGLKPTLSCDIVALNSGDLFTPMRLALAHARSVDNAVALDGGEMPERLTYRARDALDWATINGAEALGCADRIGSITPGKQADVIVLGGSAFNQHPRADAVGTVVFQSGPRDVELVLVAGRVVKEHGELVDVDRSRLLAEAEQSASSILERVRRAVPSFPTVDGGRGASGPVLDPPTPLS